ncbi:beta strand repeat-containing protein [Mycolicibacterium chlorophenolicum]|uniref:beta strand repeat-containing protein n=1 Tax=Mycolicibacterium chlorophenolicum TaxID=37916 RepID=UPI001F27756C|nr:hypothetical protein [Mycolicibacterium chlorophenolicum]
MTATPGTSSVTFFGAASVAAYQQLLQSVTFTSSSAGIATVAFTVTDDQGQSSVPASTAVTVLGVPAAIAPLVVTTPTASGTTNSAVTVSPVVLITDVDSTQLASVTIAVDGAGVLSYGTLPSGVTATPGANSVTFTGAASVAAYQQLLQSITLTSSSTGINTVTFTVTDDQGQASVPATTAVTVLGVPVAIAPLVVTAPTAAGTTGGAITVSPVVVITDVDSLQLAYAVVSVTGTGVLGYGTLPSGVTATPGTSSVTFFGAASVAAYQQLLQSVTFTSSSAGIATVAFTVTDDQGQSSVPASTAVTVLGVPAAIAPLVVTTPTASGTTNSAVTVSPVVLITDVDSTQLASVTIAVDGAGVLSYGTLPSGVTATPGANSVTFTGAASVAAYQQLLQSITLTSSSTGINTVTFTVTDDQGQASVPATTAVTVLGVPVAIAPLVVTAPTAAGTTGGAITVSPVVVITDVDSLQLAYAVVSVTGTGVLGYGTLPSGVTATPGTSSVTFFGAASVAAYQQLLQSVTLTSSSAGIATVTFTVTDDQGQSSAPVVTVVTVLGVPVAVAPLVVAAPTAAGSTGSAVSVSPAVVITDVDSAQLASATVTLDGAGVLGYGTLPSGVTATPGTSSVTFFGAASVAAYQQLLQSVTLTSSSAGIATVTFTVTDDQGQSSAPVVTVVTVLGVPVAVAPLVVAAPTAAGSTGSAVSVSPAVVITDVDSAQLASATVTLDGAGVLGYGTLPSGVTATPGTSSVTFFGAASVAAYQQLLQSVTLTSSAAGITTVTFTVTDDQGESSVPATTAVTVLGVPVAVAPLVVTAPTAAGSTGGAITVSPVVVITDVDSTQLASATVTLDGAGVLGYGTLPSGVIATAGAGSVTFAGAASVAAYEQLLQSVTLTSSSAGIATVTFTVTDDQGQTSVPATTAVTVLGVPVAIAPLVVTTPTASGTTNSAVTVSPVVLITDVDSTQLASATVSVDGSGVLGYGTLPSGVTATPDANSVTFTGAASVAAYQQLLQSITLTSSSTGINTVTFTVTDDQGQASVPATTAVTVLGVPVALAPLVVTAPTATGTTGTPVTVSPVVVITDADSTQLASATVAVDGSGVLGYGALPSGVTATPGTSSVTFFGAASVAAYQQLLQSVTFTSSSAGIATVAFTVTDDQGQSSVPASTAVTVLGVPAAIAPLVVTTPTASGTTNSAVTVSPVVLITDVDSTQLASATVSVDGSGVLGYGTLPSGVTATPDANSVTFTGAASVAAYQQLLQSITLTSSSTGINTVTFTVTDDQGQASVPATTAVTVLGVPVALAPLVVTAPTATGTTGTPVTVSPVVVITDADSTQLASATVAVDGSGVLGYGALPSGVTATPGTSSVTFFGAASVAAYQQLLQSVTLTSSSAGITTVTFTVTDYQGQASVPASTIMTVLGVPVAIAPLVVVAPTASGSTGSAVSVSPAVVITDVDSTQLASATVSVTGTGVLGYGTLPSGVTAARGANYVTFTGAASVAAYQQLLQSITLTSSATGITTVTFTVTDDQGQSGVPAATAVTVLGVPAAIAPLVVTTPTASGTTNSAVTVSPVVLITDVDSTQLASATVAVDGSGTLGYGTLPSGVTATPGTSSVTFFGAASVAAYQQLLQSVTLTSSSAGITTVTFTVTDYQGQASVPASTIMTVLGVPVAIAPLVVVAPTASGSTGSAVSVSPAVVITDVDSTQLASATVSVTGTGVLGYGTLPSGVTAARGANYVTFTGAASVAAYQQLLQSITLTSSATGITTVTFTVTDDQGQSGVPAATAVTVLGVPAAIAPLVVTTPTASGTTNSAVTVSPVVLITDVDSTQLASATVAVDGSGTLGYGTLPSGVTATSGTSSVTFFGAASVAAYQQLLQSVTLTSSSAGITTVTFTVTDYQGQASVPASTIMTVLGVPVAIAPLVVVAPTASGSTGSAVSVSPAVVITDVDSTQLASATVSVTGTGVLGYGTLPSGVTAARGANYVTFTGAASVAAYQQLLQSITLTSSATGITTVTFTVTDDQGQSGVPAATAVTVLGVPAAIAPLVVTTPTASGTTNSAVTVSPVVLITDVDSTQLASATVAVDGSGTLGYGTLPSGVTATSGTSSVTFFGAASVAAYQQLLQSVTLTSSSAGITTVTFTVTDYQGQASVPASTIMTVLGVPVAIAPLVVVAPTASGSTGSAVSVSPAVVITDVDSTQLASATVSVTGTGVLGYGTLPSGVTAARGANYVTFTGAASVAAYQQLLQSITLTSSATGITTVTFTVTDDQGQSGVPAATAVTVLGVPAAIAPLVVTTPTASGTTNSAVTVSPVVLITDVDSTQLASATVAVDGSGTLGYGTLPSGVTATSGTSSVTFFGAASVAAYQQLLQSVTLTSSSAGIATVTFAVTDDQGESSVPAPTVVTVLGVPVAVAPLVVTAPTAAGTTGTPVTVSPVVVITDVDSTHVASATVAVDGAGVLSYGTLPSGVTATPGTSSVTFTGAASVAAYEQLLQSVTLTSSSAGITTATFTVTDDQGQSSVPATTAVTVLGVPVAIAPLVVVAPTAAGSTGSAVSVSPTVVITDVDSLQLASAVVSVTGTGVLGYGTLPSGVTATPGANSVTFTGAASVAAYEQLLQSVTLTSSTTGITTVTFTVTDDQGQASVPATTAVTVVALPVAAAPVLVTSVVNVSYTAGNSAVSVDPGVIVLDADSTTMSGAVVSIVGGAAAGETLSFSAPAGITGVYSGGVLTLSGAASLASYQQALRSVTYATSSAALASVKTISFVTTDSTATTSAPALVSVTVASLPVTAAPVLVTSVVNVSYTAGNSAVSVDPGVIVLDADSTTMSGAVVSIVGGAAAGETLSFSAPAGITGVYSGGVLTLSGAASLASYQQALRSVTYATSSAALASVKTISFVTTDSTATTSAPALVSVTVASLPVTAAPVLVTSVVNVSYTAGNSAVSVDPGVIVLDADSTTMSGAVVSIVGGAAAGETLSFSAPAGITGVYSGGVLTLSGAASLASYQQALRSVTYATSSAALASVKTISFVTTDSTATTSAPALVSVTVASLPVTAAPVLVTSVVNVSYTAGNSAVSVDPGVIVLDADSTTMSGAVVSIVGGAAAGETLSFSAPAGITGVYSGGVLTLSGAASLASYQQALRSVTYATSSAALASVKTISFVTTDSTATTSAPALVSVTVASLPVTAAPVLVTSVVNVSYTAGNSAVSVDPGVIVLDADSTTMSGAVVSIVGGAAAGETLSFSAPAGITGVYSGGVLTLSGAASLASYQQALRSVTYATSSVALASVKTISFVTTDSTATTSAPALVSVTVASLPVTAAPVLVTSVVNVSYTAGNSAVSVDPGVIVLDADSTTMSGAVVSIVGGAAAGETLSFSAPAGITGVYSGGVLTLSGAASLASYQQALRSVTYATSSVALASVKTISFVITDSTATTSAPALVSVTVLAAPTNVAPLVVTSVTNVSYTAGNTAVTVDPGITVLDVDSANLSGASVTIAGSFASGDTLGFTSQAGITGSYNSATGTLTLSGTAALATYQQVLRSVTLSTGSSAPAAIKTVSFTVTDSQGASSLAGTVAVTVLAAPVDIAPLVVTSVTNVSYTAGNAGVTVDSGLTLLDLDSSNMGGATVKITGNFASGDTLSFTSQAGITGSYNSSTGTLTLSGTAALATYQQVLRSVKLSTSSSALAAIKTVSFTVSDSQGSASLPGTVTVTVLAAPINVAPLVATLVGPVYTAGNTAVSVNPLVTVTDLDSTNMTSATVAITGNFTAGDTLAFTATAGITGAYNSSTGILTLSGTATTAQYQQVLQSVTFATSGTASAAIKTITYTVTDAQGATSPSATTTVTVLANTAPVVTAPLGGAVILNQQLVSPTATIVDDSSYLQRAVITISNLQSGDNLTYTSSGGITGTYNSSTGVLTLTGLATVSDYQSVLQSLKFSKSVLNLLSTRTITMTVRDQQGLDSNTTSGIMTILL